MQIVYWLAESEVALFTKFESLKELCIDLGAEVLQDLETKYSSNRIIDEWLAGVIREDVKEDLRKCENVEHICDESTDVSVAKQLIVFACVVTSNYSVHHRHLKCRTKLSKVCSFLPTGIWDRDSEGGRFWE